MLYRLPEMPAANTTRGSEAASLRGTRGGGGRARADLLGYLAQDAHVMIGSLCLFVQGVADCLQVAGLRKNEVNLPTRSVSARPVIEVAGQILWLFEEGIGAETRARRYLIWRLSDLRHQRLTLKEFTIDDAPREAALADLDSQEGVLLGMARNAKWQGRGTVTNVNGDVNAAVLLTPAGDKAERMPSIVELVGLVSSHPAVYGLLSIPVHGRLFGALQGIDHGDSEIKMSGFGLPPNIVIGITSLAAMRSSRAVAEWNGLDVNDVLREAKALRDRLDF